jgi:hypothetical protein
MPLLEGGTSASSGVGHPPPRRHSEQFSDLARAAIMSSANSSPASETEFPHIDHDASHKISNLMPPPKTGHGRTANTHLNSMKPFHPLPQQQHGGVGIALTDTPTPTAPNSPQM